MVRRRLPRSEKVDEAQGEEIQEHWTIPLIKQRGVYSSVLIIGYVMSSVVCSGSVRLPVTQGIRRSSEIKLTFAEKVEKFDRTRSMLRHRLIVRVPENGSLNFTLLPKRKY